MKKLIVPFCLACGFAAPALAQSSVSLYGLIDTTIRYTTHENASGDGKVQMGDGVLTGTRFGMQGTETLGNGYRAFFVLENGFLPDTGMASQGGRLFGRKAFVGLGGDFGSLKLGRDFTVIHEVIASYDTMALPNLGLIAFQSGNYTGGVRQDNMLKYSGTFGPVTVAAQHAFGEVAGSFPASSSTGASVTYSSGNVKLAGGYQIMRDTATYFGTAVPVSDQQVWSAGGTYRWGKTLFNAGFTRSTYDRAGYRDNAYYAGLKHAFDDAWTFYLTGTYDRMKINGDGGNRYTAAMMVDYNLSKRTDVYLEADYSSLTGTWRTLASQPNFVTPFFGHGNRIGVTTGLRHKF